MNYDRGLFMISINKLNYSENKSLFQKAMLMNKYSLSNPITNKYEWKEIENDPFEIIKFIMKSFI